jgi:branched-chain amino acid aminotransferase
MLSTTSSQAYAPDPRNADVKVYLNGEFVHRDAAQVSIFDAGFVCGDGVWEGLRLVQGRLVALQAHLDRLFEGALSIDLDIGLSRAEVEKVLWDTLAINGMTDGAHLRLMVTRGRKSTPNQDPRFIVGKATVVCVAEYKVVDAEAKSRGISLFTSTFRCSTPDVFDLRLNSHSRLNLIQALLQALHAGADEALMLDSRGFVASCNSTNFFIVRKGELWTSSAHCCFNGITRQTLVSIAREQDIIVHEGEFTLAQVYSADEAFVTGTLAGITPVKMVDGRPIGSGVRSVSASLDQLYQRSIFANGQVAS